MSQNPRVLYDSTQGRLRVFRQIPKVSAAEHFYRSVLLRNHHTYLYNIDFHPRGNYNLPYGIDLAQPSLENDLTQDSDSSQLHFENDSTETSSDSDSTETNSESDSTQSNYDSDSDQTSFESDLAQINPGSYSTETLYHHNPRRQREIPKVSAAQYFYRSVLIRNHERYLYNTGYYSQASYELYSGSEWAPTSIRLTHESDSSDDAPFNRSSFLGNRFSYTDL